MNKVKTALVTGATGNLGKAVCDYFLQRGYFVIRIISPSGELSENQNSKSFRIDLADENQVNDVFREIIATYPEIDAGIFLAGGFQPGKIEASDGEKIEKMLNLNFKTAYFISRCVYMNMKDKNGGRLCFIGAKPGLPGSRLSGSTAYALSKTMLFKLSEIYNAEGRDHGIVASVFVPSVIDTPENRKSMPGADFSKWVKAESIASAIFFFCSEEGISVRDGIFKMYGDS